MTVTSTRARLSARAAYRPPKPPPMMTTLGRATCTEEESHDDHRHRADDVVPEERDRRRAEIHGGHGSHPGEQPDERRRRPRARYHREQEDAENRPVEEGPEAIHDFDERSQVDCEDGDDAGEQAPEHRSQL